MTRHDTCAEGMMLHLEAALAAITPPSLFPRAPLSAHPEQARHLAPGCEQPKPRPGAPLHIIDGGRT